MSANHFFKSIHIENYRGINKLDINSLRRVNIFGGLNGAGKSTIIEGLFSVLDIYNPLCVIRPNLLRNSPLDFSSAVRNYFYKQQTTNIVKFSSKTEIGKIDISITNEKQPSFLNNQPQKSPNPHLTTSTFNQDGLTINYKINNSIVDIFHLIGFNDNINFRTERATISNMPSAVFFNKFTMSISNEMCERFSVVVQEKRKDKIISCIKTISDNLNDLVILTYGGQTHITAKYDNEVYIPISLIGGGVVTLLNICLAIMVSKNGAVFLDEFDTAIHYSKLTKVWNIIDELSQEHNCQIFAVTHSAECIKSAADHFNKSEKPNDFVYYRIDRVDNETKSTQYESDETLSAIKNEWEIR